MHTEARLLASELLSKLGVFWDQISAEVEYFCVHLVTNTYGEALSSGGRAECCTVVLKMMRVAWR